MMYRIPRRPAASCYQVFALVLGFVLLGACDALEVSDPTVIEDAELNNATGAELLRRDVLHALATAFGQGAITSGLLADEFFADPSPTFAQSGSRHADEALDRRQSAEYEELASAATSGYSQWQSTRLGVMQALPRVRTYTPEPQRSPYVGQMLAVRGFATLHLAEDFCPGLPLHDFVDGKLIIGAPHSTAELFESALADFDSARVYAADSTRIMYLAQLGRARALLGLGRFTDAGAAVSSVPTSYVWNLAFSVSGSPRNPLLFTRTATNSRRSVADREGGTGLDYVSANDPRVSSTRLGLAYDNTTEIRSIGKYPDAGAPMLLASGVEARLIEAETALRAGDPQWLTVLNQLRQTQITPTLPALSDPATAAGQLDLVFRERAFWLFATAHRLGDLRRLAQQYGRSPDTVFPSGTYRLGGLTGAGTSVPFTAAPEQVYNPAVTGCSTR
jgi:hypothetical protein